MEQASVSGAWASSSLELSESPLRLTFSAVPVGYPGPGLSRALAFPCVPPGLFSPETFLCMRVLGGDVDSSPLEVDDIQ